MRKYLERYGFKFNPYDPCVANNIIKEDLGVVVFHVYGIRASNKDKKYGS